MFEAYRIGVSVALTGNVATALGLWKKQFQEAGVMTTALQKRMDDLKNTGKRAAIEIGAAWAVAKPFTAMISDAAKLQKEMIGISLGARGTAQDLDRLRGVIEDTAGKTMFSNIDVAKMAKQLATGTGWDRAKVAQDLPVFAQFADAQQIMKGTPYSQSVTTGIQLAHQAGYSDPAAISRYLDLLTNASLTIPGGLGELSHALKYSQNALATLGLSDDQSILLNATLNRMGLSGSRGGTTAVAALTRSIPGIFGSGLLTGKSAEALRAMGMADERGHSTVFQDGKFSTIKFIDALANYEAGQYSQFPEAIARQNILSTLQKAGGVNGARGMEILASPAARTALQSAQQSIQSGAGTAAIQQAFADQSVLQQYNNAKTNMTTLMSELGYKLLPLATTSLQAFNAEISKLTGWVRDPKNDGVVKAGLATGIGGAGLLGIGGIINATRFALKGLGLTRTAGVATSAATSTVEGGIAMRAASKAAMPVVIAGAEGRATTDRCGAGCASVEAACAGAVQHGAGGLCIGGAVSPRAVVLTKRPGDAT